MIQNRARYSKKIMKILTNATWRNAKFSKRDSFVPISHCYVLLLYITSAGLTW